MTCGQVIVYIYITANFQLRSSIHAALTIGFALKNLPKWGFWGFLGGGAKIFGGNPLGNDRRSTSFGEKIMEML